MSWSTFTPGPAELAHTASTQVVKSATPRGSTPWAPVMRVATSSAPQRWPVPRRRSRAARRLSWRFSVGALGSKATHRPTRWLRRLPPGMVAPRCAWVRTPPASDGPGGNRGDEAVLHGHRGECLATPPLPHVPMRLGQGAGPRNSWRPHHRGKVTRDTRPGPVGARVRHLPALLPPLDRLQAAADG